MAEYARHVLPAPISGGQEIHAAIAMLTGRRTGAGCCNRPLVRQDCGHSARADKAGCLDQCEHGPVVVVYPEGDWYGNVTEEDVAEIVQTHLAEGRLLQRLLLDGACINTPSCKHGPLKF